MKGKCPKCGWETRELDADECDLVRQGRLRCSGECQGGGISLTPGPKLRLEEESNGDN